MAPPARPTISDMHVCGTSEWTEPGPKHNSKPHRPLEGVLHADGIPSSGKPCESGARHRRDTPTKRLCTEGHTGGSTGGDHVSHQKPPCHRRPHIGRSNHSLHVLWGSPPIRGGPALGQGIRPAKAPHARRRDSLASSHPAENKSGQKHAEIRPEGRGPLDAYRAPRNMPGQSDHGGDGRNANYQPRTANVCLQERWSPNPGGIP